MPKIPDRREREMEAMMKAVEEARANFEAGFRRSNRTGNLWRSFEGMTLSVFKRDGLYRWCIANGEGTRFSESSYESEGEAVGSLWSETAGQDWV
jgi:hypothetical protein